MSTSPPTTSTPLSAQTAPISADLPPVEVNLIEDPGAIEDVYAKPPLEWNEADMLKLISDLRAKRVEWDKEEAKEKKPRKAAKEKVNPALVKKASANDLLDLIGLGHAKKDPA